jgi:hypothetical protein
MTWILSIVHVTHANHACLISATVMPYRRVRTVKLRARLRRRRQTTSFAESCLVQIVQCKGPQIYAGGFGSHATQDIYSHFPSAAIPLVYKEFRQRNSTPLCSLQLFRSRQPINNPNFLFKALTSVVAASCAASVLR